MVFSSAVFLFVFFPLCLAGYYLIPKSLIAVKNIFLLIMSLAFYGYGEPKFVYVMILSIFVNWGFGLCVDRFRGKVSAKICLAGMVVWNVGIFFVYKYLDFAIINIDRFLGFDFELPGFVLPIGISFFTFQAMSYVIDVYRGTALVQKNPLNTALFISFFPQLMAGPIVRYNSIAEQLTGRSGGFDLESFSYGVKRFIIGLSKKLILANTVAVVADRAFGAPAADPPTLLTVWLGAVCYAFQIYFDFSGYSDMAIGLGRMFGFRFLENFNYPYISRTITEFWRRWHISLSSWFRDYVYIPLGGSRVPMGRLIFNLFVTWMLTGVWHGAGWNYIAWGLMYFVLLAFEKLVRIPERTAKTPLLAIPYRIFTIVCFLFGWVIFRASGLAEALRYLKVMVGLSVDGQHFPAASELSLFYVKDNWMILIICVLACTPILTALTTRVHKGGARLVKTWDALGTVCLIALFVICVSYMVNGSYNPFIYFNF
ncbi:MAG: MBOAT family protein [Clostridiales Family XIII bacterium]|jgi:alginate O-acetyltransferase complex protein AlgI|nr:MBOAT family protein [Clostridiales Family XIII bacterium]